ncbi:MAG TPA: MFS transporter [Ilumatobacter sp.]|nr:MFS transporter [Ilumatobacter sp.]
MPRHKVLQFGVLTAVLASGYGVMFTVLDDFRDEYGISEIWLGSIVGIGFLASFVSQVFIAPIADRGRARQLVVAGMLLNVVGLLTMAFGESLLPLLGGRLVSGIGVGMALPAVRRIVINADPINVGNNVGLLLASDVTGFALGPVVSAILVPWFGLSAPFLFISALTLVLMTLVFRVDIVEASRVHAPPQRFAFDLLRNRPLVAGLLMGSAIFFMIGTFDAMWAIVLDDLEASELLANIGITIFALPLVFLGAFGGRLAQRVGPFRLGPLGLALGAVYMALYGFMPTAWAMLAVAVVHSISDGLTVTSAGVAVATAAPPDRQAGAQGMLGAAETLTGGVTAQLAGALYMVGGRELAYSVCAIVMLLMAGGAFLLAGSEYRTKRPIDVPPGPDPASAVTGHA